MVELSQIFTRGKLWIKPYFRYYKLGVVCLCAWLGLNDNLVAAVISMTASDARFYRYSIVIFTLSGPLGLWGSTFIFGNRVVLN